MRRLITSAFLLVALAFGQAAGAATITKPFNFTLGPAYSGLASTVSYKVVLVDGSTPIGPVTATGITEGSFGAVTATGSYNVNVANFDTGWAGKIVWVESTSGLVYEEPFGVSQSTDVTAALAATSSNVAAVKAKTDNLPASPAAVGSAMTLASGAIATGSFASGATIPAVASVAALSPSERSALATAILTDASGGNQATPGSLGSMVGINNGIAVLGTVNDLNPSGGSFVISLASGTLPSDNRYIGLSLSFTGALAPAKAKITGYQLLTGTTARVWFANPFSVIPTNGAPFTVF
ncbi:hypothetical protein [Singulisphaera sp. PoT]|uniref:hypothetical protein n=1 Tax=Singulisphaera sp. PoT TaxID=3411797 RepID=UPI003BF4E3C1